MTAADHANIVREGLLLADYRFGEGKEVHAALDALVAQAEAAATVDCENCGFRYGAEHTLADGSYSCSECDRIAAEADRDRLADVLRHVQVNAESWHGPEGLDTGHARALAVIAEWCRAALAQTEHTP